MDDGIAWREYVDEACTIGGATGSATRNRGPLLFSTSDDPFDTRTRLVVAQPRDGYRFIATQIVSPPPPVAFNQMHTRGLNTAGFAYTWAAVRPVAEPADHEAIGIPYEQFGRFLLSWAATVEDAIALLREFPRAYHGNFLFADAHGEIALVEVSTESLHVETRTTDGVVARANHWISPQMAPVGGEVAASSRHRHQRAHELITAQAGAIDPASLQEITSDHAGQETSGVSICAHGIAPSSDAPARWAGTVSSEIIEPQQGRFWYCYGWACGAVPKDPAHQQYQDRSWGVYVPFDLADLEPGEYVTTDGRVTAQGLQHLAKTRAAASAQPT